MTTLYRPVLIESAERAALAAEFERALERALEAISRIDPDVLREVVALYESQSRPRRQILHNGRKPR